MGYKTAYFGKWQLSGGDETIRAFGFDSYCVINPILGNPIVRYKNPTIYSNGKYASAELIQNNYSEDIFADSVKNFMERNKETPFFIYYPMALCRAPFQPTPDNPDFANWPVGGKSDTSYFTFMMNYMDKR